MAEGVSQRPPQRAGLSAAEREFLGLVSRAAYANPFSAERAALDARIAADASDADDADSQRERLLARLRVRLEAIDRRLGAARLSPEDQALVAHGTFFEVFHRFAPELDGLIEAQLEAGGRRLPVPFARAILGRLTARQVPDAEAERILGFLWQIRRAWRFIGGGVVGGGAQTRALREGLWSSVFTHDIARFEAHLWDRLEDFPVLILGETGSGKGAAAAAIGRSGFIPYDPARGAFQAPFPELFVPVNLGEFAEPLIESALFGHRKGAFTGAVEDHPGLLSRVPPHGAILLDEIGEVSLPTQVKLLRVLQERQITPVGGSTPTRFTGRILAATHQDLDALRQAGRFRHDFYYRLCGHVVQVPPLRIRLAEAPEELFELVDTLVTRILGAPVAPLSASVAAQIQAELGPAHPWPGNVRELEQVIRRVLLTGRCGAAGPAARAPGPDGADALAQALRDGALSADAVLDRYCALLLERHGTHAAVARITGLDRRTARKRALRGQAEATAPR